MRTKSLFVLFFMLFTAAFSHGLSQEKPEWPWKKTQQKPTKKEPLVKISVRKSGPYFGLQQGAYTFAEIGGEMQYKRVKLKQPTTYAVNAGGLYNITNNVFGINAGGWQKSGRFDFTYGVNFAYRTDFKQSSVGFGPVVGYKVFGFHFLAGYDFMSNRKSFAETNTLYVAARFLLVTDRKTKWEWRKRNKD